MTETLIQLERYTPLLKEKWDDFVESSKNGTFLFNRDYMDYHADRFQDFSFLIYRKEKLYALLPANLKDGVLYSHRGLTYGGLIMNDQCTAQGILEVFEVLKEHLKKEGIYKFIYKPVPHIYHRLPAEEDLYALFRHNATLVSRNISSTISLENPLKFKKDRREAVRRAIKNEIKVRTSTDFDTFWKILEENLKQNYNASPVHSVEEIKNLAALFPENISLYSAFKGENMVAGLVAYYTPTTLHAQYISANNIGKASGAIDLIVSGLLLGQNSLRHSKWFDLGTSNEDGGRYLNESLIYQKEGFGGRGICYDTYEINLL